MQITITIEGVERTYNGDYDKLTANDYNEIVEDMLDTVKNAEDPRFFSKASHDLDVAVSQLNAVNKDLKAILKELL